MRKLAPAFGGICAGSAFFIDGRLHMMETMRNTGQGLGVPRKQQPAEVQPLPEALDKSLLGRLVEVDHHIPAENEVKASAERPRLIH
jgi:hypothetical protein